MESSRKRKKEVEKKSWRKNEKGRFWNEVESREKKKKERMEIMGIRVWWRKIKRKEKEKKGKRKGNVWMIERKKGKIQFRNATTIFSQ